MKNKMQTLSYVLGLIMYAFINTYQLLGQEKMTVSAGIGFPEALNIGILYQFNQLQIGLSIGTYPASESGISRWSWESLISLSGDFYYHFNGSSKYSEIRPWYGRIGLNCLRLEECSYIKNKLNTYLRLGRDFNLLKGFGISIDVGAGVHFYDWFIEKGQSNSRSYYFGIVAIPTFGVCLFYRLPL